MHWKVDVEAEIPEGFPPKFEESANHRLERFGGRVQVEVEHVRATFTLEAPSLKRVVKVALMVFARIAGQHEPSRFELVRLPSAEVDMQR